MRSCQTWDESSWRFVTNQRPCAWFLRLVHVSDKVPSTTNTRLGAYSFAAFRRRAAHHTTAATTTPTDVSQDGLNVSCTGRHLTSRFGEGRNTA